jgi:hypothetical protein
VVSPVVIYFSSEGKWITTGLTGIYAFGKIDNNRADREFLNEWNFRGE